MIGQLTYVLVASLLERISVIGQLNYIQQPNDKMFFRLHSTQVSMACL